MLKGENIICISSIDWDFVWQGHQEIMSTFAKAGNKVLFIENTGVRTPVLKDATRLKVRFLNWRKASGGIRKVENNVYVFSPLIFPFPYSRIFRYINKLILLRVLKKWTRAMNFKDIIFWSYLPTDLSQDIIGGLGAKLSVYCCIDNLSLSSKASQKIIEPEARFVRKVDLVFVTGRNLYNHCRQYRNDNIYLFREGVNIKHFQGVLKDTSLVPSDLKDIPRPIIGYIGGIHKWVDQELIKYLAYRHPEVSFVFVGPLQVDVFDLKKMPNIYFLGQKNREKLPLYIKEFKICIIPYLISDYINNVYPTKLNEYLALGKPVISTAMPEVIYFNEEYGNIVNIAHSKEEFSNTIKRLLMQEEDLEAVEKRLVVARQNSWQARIEKMSEKIEGTINR